MNQPIWRGIANYAEILADEQFGRILLNTLIFTLIYVAGVLVTGMGLAVLLNVRLPGIGVYRALVYSPVVTSAVAIGIVWSWILSGRFGVINHLLSVVDISGPYWLGEKAWALPSVSVVQVWKMAGYYMTIFIAGLQEISKDLYESAEIDGATGMQKFRRITLPMLSPFTFFVLTIALIDSFNNFEIVYSMTRGGPQSATTTLVYSVFVNGFVFYRLGYASAIAFILMVVVGSLTGFNFILRKRWAASHE